MQNFFAGVEMAGRQVAKCDQHFYLATRHLPSWQLRKTFEMIIVKP
jgi:hypothetical protein